jgi:putative ABC transport system permease protein
MPEQGLTLRLLALQNVRRKPYRNFGLAVLVGIFSALLFGGSILNNQLGRGLESLSDRLGADILIVPSESKHTATATLLRGEPSTYYMPKEVLDKIRNIPGVMAATPQFFLASLSSPCCAELVQIMGFDPESDFLIHPWIQNKIDTVKVGEVVAGAKISYDVGEEIFFFGTTYRIAAKMDYTGMGLDVSVFLPLTALYDLVRANPHLLQQFDNPPEQYISSVAVKVSPGLLPQAVGKKILQTYAAEYKLDQILAESVVTDTALRLHNLSTSVYWFAACIWVLSLLVISLVFSVTVGERKNELSIYRLIGAQRSWVGRLLLLEAFFICSGGAVLGMLVAACIVFPFSTLIFSSLQLPHLGISGEAVAGYALLTLAIAGLSGPLASLNSVFSLMRFDVYSTLREGE